MDNSEKREDFSLWTVSNKQRKKSGHVNEVTDWK